MGKLTLIDFLVEYIKSNEDIDKEHWYFLNLGDVVLSEMGPLDCAFDPSDEEYIFLANGLDVIIKDKFYHQIESKLF